MCRLANWPPVHWASRCFRRPLAVKAGEGNGTPLQYSCLENPMDGGAWKAAVHGVTEDWTWLSNFPFTFHFHALEKEMATHSSVLAWRVPGTGDPGGLLSMGSHRDGHEWNDLAVAVKAKNIRRRWYNQCLEFSRKEALHKRGGSQSREWERSPPAPLPSTKDFTLFP